MDKNSGESCICLDRISKYFDGHQVLKEVCLEVPYGIIYGLLGPSGCGKTTSVKIMAGIMEASDGSTRVLGQPMPSLELMNRIGYMAQTDALYDLLTARENLEFFGSVYGLIKGQLQERISYATSLVNLTDHLDKQVSKYSTGMKRRLSLAIAILHDPKILILDEPTVGIDPVLRKEIWDELNRMTQRGISILVTTHVMDEAEKCAQLSMMRDGAIIATGTPGEIMAGIKAGSLEEAFILYSTKDSPGKPDPDSEEKAGQCNEI